MGKTDPARLSGVKSVAAPTAEPKARERITPVEGAARAGARGSCPLEVTVVYEDSASRRWACQFCDRVVELVGRDAVRSAWWKLGDLGEPAVLAGAVSTALRADVIIVTVRAAEGLPLPFYVWVDSWLPHHAPGTAALVALIAMPDNPGSQLDRASQYLRTVARQGRMDFHIEERKLSAEATTPA